MSNTPVSQNRFLLLTSNLAKKLDVVREMEFLRTSFYGNATKSLGKINMLPDFDRDGFHECYFLIIEDIVDSGRMVDCGPDCVGKVIPDEFVFGYGLDLFEQYCVLPYVAVVSPAFWEQLGK